MAEILGFIVGVGLLIGFCMIAFAVIKNLWMKVSPEHKEMRDYEKKMKDEGKWN